MHNVLKKMMGVKFNIASYRIWVPRASKRGVLGVQKFNFLHKWLNLQGWLELIWRSFFAYIHDFFCAILSFWDIVTFSKYCVQILQAFLLSVLAYFFQMMFISRCTMLWSEHWRKILLSPEGKNTNSII